MRFFAVIEDVKLTCCYRGMIWLMQFIFAKDARDGALSPSVDHTIVESGRLDLETCRW